MTALFIALERPIDGFDPYVLGHALSLACDDLEVLAAELKVTPLMHFFGEDVSDAAWDEDEVAEDDADELPEERWFAAADGVRTIDTLLQRLSANPKAINGGPAVIKELQGWRQVLERAAEEGVAWHLEIDF